MQPLPCLLLLSPTKNLSHGKQVPLRSPRLNQRFNDAPRHLLYFNLTLICSSMLCCVLLGKRFSHQFPFGGVSSSSKLHLRSARHTRGVVWPARNISIPAQAIMAALSVHSSGGG